MAYSSKIINPVSVPRPAKFRGPLTSQDYNQAQSEIISDVHSLANIVNSLNVNLSRNFTVLQNENAYLRRLVDSLKAQQSYNEEVSAYTNGLVTRMVDLSDTKGISFPNGLDDSQSPMLSAEFGEVTLPANSTENKFYFTSLVSNKIVPPNTLIVNVKGEFDKKEGDGLVNYERGGKVFSGNPENAFNGVNDSYWIRRVEFPLDSRVDQVECELTVVVPDGSRSQANTLELYPFPNGSVDVVELATASDLGDNYTRLSTFTPVNNLALRRYHFGTTAVEQVKVRLRQRNWIEEDGKKVFYYGLQELGLKLVDYDRTYTEGAAFGANNAFTLRIDAPSGFSFNRVFRVDPRPNFFLEDMSKRHVHVKLSTSSDPASPGLWDSDLDTPPQNQSDPLNASSAVIYAFVELNFVSSSGGTLSPFDVGTTPYINGLGLSFNLLPIS